MHLSNIQYWVMFVSVLVWTNSGMAASPSSSLMAEEHFRLGVRHYQEGRYDESIAEFANAYEISHDYHHLYNLAQANAARWKPVEALEIFERYLRDGESAISAQRRTLVEQAIALQRARIGWLELRVSPNGAVVRVDGKAIGRSPIVEPVPVVIGEHVVSVSLDGYQYEEQKHTLKARERKPAVFTLAKAPPPTLASPPQHKGQIAIDCQVPEVQVLVDEHVLATTPVRMNLLVEEGARRVRFERQGYLPQEAVVEVNETGLAHAKCVLSLAKQLAPNARGRLSIEWGEAGAIADVIVTVDGTPSPTQTTLPTGLHVVEVQREGFVPLRQEVRLEPGQDSRLWVSLRPTEAHQRDLQARAQTRRNWAYALGALGIATLGTAAGIGGWNHGRYKQWETERDYLSNPANADKVDYEHRLNDARDLDRSVRRLDLLTVGLAVASGLTLTGAAVLYFGGEHLGHSSDSRSK